MTVIWGTNFKIMTLSFKTQINGVSNYFVEKILSGIEPLSLRHELPEVVDYNVFTKCPAKIHTIREDKKDRWKAGNKIHFVINNRTKNRLQFAPVLPCVSTQKIIIEYSAFFPPLVAVDGRKLNRWEIKELAINDGFDSVEDFFSWFNEDFTGKIIHWTDCLYCG